MKLSGGNGVVCQFWGSNGTVLKLGGTDAIGLELCITNTTIPKSSIGLMGLGEIVIEYFTPFALIGAGFG